MWKLVVGWCTVVLVTTLVAWQIVSLADAQVNAPPVEIVAVSDTAPESTTTSALTESTTTTSPLPTTSLPQTGSTTASERAEWSVRTVATSGGTVIVRYRAGRVELQAATPKAGFEMEIDDDGPQRVRVEFEGEGRDIRVEVEWRDSGLETEVTGDI